MDLVLETDRLTLVPFGEDDVDIAIEIFASPDVMRYGGGAMEPDEVRQAMPTWTRRGGNGCVGVWCIRDTETRDKLGTGALLPMPIEEDDTDWNLVIPGQIPAAEIEVGYFLKPSAWGRGYATEACLGLLQFAFEESPFTEIAATHDEGNDASRRVLLKSGFVSYGTRRCYGEEGPDLRISRADWLKRRRPAARHVKSTPPS